MSADDAIIRFTTVAASGGRGEGGRAEEFDDAARQEMLWGYLVRGLRDQARAISQHSSILISPSSIIPT